MLCVGNECLHGECWTLNVSSLAAGMLPDGMSRVKEGECQWSSALKIHIRAQRSIAYSNPFSSYLAGGGPKSCSRDASDGPLGDQRPKSSFHTKQYIQQYRLRHPIHDTRSLLPPSPLPSLASSIRLLQLVQVVPGAYNLIPTSTP